MIWRFDFFSLITGVGAVLLIVGVLPLTPAVVGALILLSLFEFSITIGES